MPEIDGRIIILILFVVISAVKWLLEKIKNQGETSYEESESLEDIYEEFREQIRQRQTTVRQEPPAHNPPPLPHASQPAQQVPVQQVPVQQTYQSPPVQEVANPYNDRTTKPRKPSLSAEEKAALARFQQNTFGKRRRKTSPHRSVRALLSGPMSARQAIVLTEILGKPKSLQSH